jgi:peptidoglycan/LPS O-acetylase OafA/YrhL
MGDSVDSGDSPARKAYLPALDGMRGLAVLAVLLYHGDVSWASGGFLGVDAFFVLSGFLITSLLLDEWMATGTVALRTFWSRRARRLLPALLLVLVAVAVVAAISPAVFDPGRVRGDSVAGLGYVANWRLLFTGESYFDMFVAPSPLRHLWSLGIEEQFYFVWPFLVVGVLRVTRGSLTALTAVTSFLATISAFLMVLIHQPGEDPSRVYYATDTRAQSLLIGALVVLVAAGRPVLVPAARVVVHGLAIVALAALVWVWATTPDTSTLLYEGGLTVSAVLVALVLVSITQPRAGPLGWVLSQAPIRQIGIVSYGLYLWHWPVYVLMSPARTGLDGTSLLLTRLAVSGALATASYVLVEAPIRHGALPRLAPVLTPAAVLAVGAGVFLATSGFVHPEPSSATAARSQLSDLAANPRATSEFRSSSSSSSAAVAGPPPKVLIVGDSVAMSLGYQLSTTGPFRVETTALLGCGLMRGQIYSDGAPRPTSDDCDAWPATWQQRVDQMQPDIAVILVGAWELFDRKVDGQMLSFGSPEFEARLRAEMDLAISVLQSHGAEVVLLTSPCFRPLDGDLADWGEERSDDSRVDWLNRLYRSYATTNLGSVQVADLHGLLCPNGEYLTELEGHPLRFDGVHLTPPAADLTWRWLEPALATAAEHHARPS